MSAELTRGGFRKRPIRHMIKLKRTAMSLSMLLTVLMSGVASGQQEPITGSLSLTDGFFGDQHSFAAAPSKGTITSDNVVFRTTCCESNSYQGIVPLKSTRADVERVFGKPMPAPFLIYGGRYQTKTRQIDFGYSRGRCSEDRGAGLDAPKDVVIDIRERFLDRIRFRDLKINKAGFKRSRANIGSVIYDDEKNGIGITVDARSTAPEI